MKVLQVFNQYRSTFNGEELVVLRTQRMLQERGIECPLLMPSSRDIVGNAAAKASAFFSGIYSLKAEREMRSLLRRERPDIVHCHNLYPLLSPSVLAACRKAGVPVVVSVHNQVLTCPTADHMHRGEMCRRCYGGKEHHCVLQNCRGNMVESIGYAVRSAVARRFRLYSKNATLLIALTDFARQWLAGAGYDPQQVAVLHNFVEQIHEPVDPAAGGYAAFAGRLSEEKDAGTLLRAARLLPGCELRLAGEGPQAEQLRQEAPANVKFLGRVEPERMGEFYRGARCLVLTSKAFEMCPLVISEAMSHGLPVVASRIGGVDELVDDGVTGLLFEPGNERDLADKLQQLWRDAELCRRLGRAGLDKAVREFGEDAYVGKLLAIYRRAAHRVGRTLPAFDSGAPRSGHEPPQQKRSTDGAPVQA